MNQPEGTLSDAAREDSARQLEGPALPAESVHLAGWWRELADTRQSGGFGMGSLTYSEMLAWAHLSGRTPTPWEVDCILAGDRAFVAEFSATAERPSDYDPITVMQTFDEEDARESAGR